VLGRPEELPMTSLLVWDYTRFRSKPFSFILVVNELTKGIQDELSWCILFADNIVLMDESRQGVNDKLE